MRGYRGIQKFDAVLAQIGLEGDVPSTIQDILVELAAIRHCVVHRGGLIDLRFLESCPWIDGKVDSPLPVSVDRYWYHRTAVYWYVLELVRRWAEWQKIAALSSVAQQMHAVVLDELRPEWEAHMRVVVD